MLVAGLAGGIIYGIRKCDLPVMFINLIIGYSMLHKKIKTNHKSLNAPFTDTGDAPGTGIDFATVR